MTTRRFPAARVDSSSTLQIAAMRGNLPRIAVFLVPTAAIIASEVQTIQAAALFVGSDL